MIIDLGQQLYTGMAALRASSANDRNFVISQGELRLLDNVFLFSLSLSRFVTLLRGKHFLENAENKEVVRV